MRKLTKKRLFVYVFIVGLILIISGLSLAVFQYRGSANHNYSISGTSASASLLNANQNLNISGSFPTNWRETQLNAEFYTFSVVFAVTNNNFNYDIKLVENAISNGSTRMDYRNISYTLEVNNEKVKVDCPLPEDLVLYTGTAYAKNQSDTYHKTYSFRLWLWINEDFEISDSEIKMPWVSRRYSSSAFANMEASYKVNVSAVSVPAVVFAKNTNYRHIYDIPHPQTIEVVDGMYKLGLERPTSNYNNNGEYFIGWSENNGVDYYDYLPGDYVPSSVKVLYPVFSDENSTISEFMTTTHDSEMGITYHTYHAGANFYSKVREIKFVHMDYWNLIVEYNDPTNFYTEVWANSDGWATHAWMKDGSSTVFVASDTPIYYLGYSAGLSTGLFQNFSLLQTIDLTNIDFSLCQNAKNLFKNISLNSLDLKGQSFAKVYTADGMFENNKITSLDLSDTNFKSLRSMNQMFYNCSKLEEIKLPKVENATSVNSFFYSCSSLKSLDLNMINSSKVKDMKNAFHSCNSLEHIYMADWEGAAINLIDGAFAYTSNLTTVNLDKLNPTRVSDYTGLFAYSGIKYVNFDYWTFDNAYVVLSTFGNCPNLVAVDLSHAKSKGIVNFTGMFSFSPNLKFVNLTGIKAQSSVNITGMFSNCSGLTTIYAKSDLFSTISSSTYLFSGCNSLVGGNGTHFSTDSVTYARIDAPGQAGYFTQG